MNTEIKWADVARMYAKSGIFIRLIPYQTNQFTRGAVTINQGDYRLIYANDVGCFYGYGDNKSVPSLSTYGKHQPILRHREDITEEEAREFMNGFALFDWEEAKGLPHGYKSAKQWFIEYFSDDFITPAQTLWLLNRGFDLFGLIESGQAIRKEVSNG